MIDLTVSEGSGSGFWAKLTKQGNDRIKRNGIAFNIITITD
jgi:hypothetical protein